MSENPETEARRRTLLQLLIEERAMLIVILFVVLMVGGLAWPAYQDNVARRQVWSATRHAEAIGQKLKEACSSGAFAAAQTLESIGARASDPQAFVAHAELKVLSATSRRLLVVLDPVYTRGSGPAGQGARLELEYGCSATKAFSMRLASTTIKLYDLPAALRP